MAPAQWESLCDGCAKCCLHKLEDADTGEVSYTAVACRLLDIDACRCLAYEKRHDMGVDCAHLTPESVRAFHWLPETCAYRRVAESRDLPDWHPLMTGDPGSVHDAGMSVRHRVISELHADLRNLEAYVIGDFSK